MGILRKTRAVEILVNEFINNKNAISAKDLIQRYESKINKTTIYRILDKLEDDGIIHSLLDKNGIRFYAKCKNCCQEEHFCSHSHFQCLECGKIDCLLIDTQLPEIKNREVNAAQTLIQGKCESCSI